VRGRCRGALGEEAVAPGTGLEHEILARRERPVRAEEAELLEAGRADDGRARAAEGATAHADRVDLVDEDDGLPAPLARHPLRLRGEVAHDDDVHADERLREAGAGNGDEGRVEVRRDRLRHHRLPRAGGAQEQKATLALAAGSLERLARLPEVDDPPHLLLRLGLPADVLELHAPVRVARLVGADLRDPHEGERAEEDEEVEEEEDWEDEKLEERARGDEVPDRAARYVGGVEPRAAAPAQNANEKDGREDPEDPDREPGFPAPEVGSAAVDDVLVLDLHVVRAEERRPGYETADDDVDEAAEGRHDRERRGDRPADPPVVLLIEPEVHHRGGDDRDDRGGAREAAPLVGERARALVPERAVGGGVARA
jgi:hypothetical protein